MRPLAAASLNSMEKAVATDEMAAGVPLVARPSRRGKQQQQSEEGRKGKILMASLTSYSCVVNGPLKAELDNRLTTHTFTACLNQIQGVPSRGLENTT